MQCGHTGNSNTSGSGRNKDNNNSDSAGSANSRSISESVIVQLEGETPVTQCDHAGHSNISGSGRNSANVSRDSGSAKLTSDCDTVTTQLEEESLGGNMRHAVYELKCTTSEGEVERGNKSKEYDSQRAEDSIVPENKSLMNSTRPVTEGNSTHSFDVPLESSCSGEPVNRLTEDDDEDDRPIAEDNTTYCIYVPLDDSFHCRICAPIPKWYKRHGDLSKHTRRYHARRFVFRCHGCSEVFANLKECKGHQTSTDCGKLPVTTRSPSQPPLSQQHNTLPVRRCRLPTPVPKEQQTTAPETRNTSTYNEQTDNNFIFVNQARNNDQASNIQALESTLRHRW